VLDEARFWRLKRAGATTREALASLGARAAVAERAARRWGERIESDEWLSRDRALPGVARSLESLRRSDRGVAVLTARRRAVGAARSLEAAGLDRLIDELIVVDPADAATAKARELRRLQALVFVGDTESDGEAARRADVPFAAVSTGQRSPGFLSARGYEPHRSLRGALSAFRGLARIWVT
jgi:phosphoglycolate phosphatase-like HAD superfamily hydrolase